MTSTGFYQFQKVLNFDSAALDFKRLCCHNPTCKANPMALAKAWFRFYVSYLDSTSCKVFKKTLPHCYSGIKAWNSKCTIWFIQKHQEKLIQSDLNAALLAGFLKVVRKSPSPGSLPTFQANWRLVYSSGCASQGWTSFTNKRNHTHTFVTHSSRIELQLMLGGLQPKLGL